MVARVARPTWGLADWPVRALVVGVESLQEGEQEDPGGGGKDDFSGDAVGVTPAGLRGTVRTTLACCLHNPLLQLERMGCRWLDVIFEWEGVFVEDDTRLERQAWLTPAEEDGKSPPTAFKRLRPTTPSPRCSVGLGTPRRSGS